jgi:RNA recognition motif-containing protein
MFGKKVLPPGAYIYLSDLPTSATEEGVARFFAQFIPINTAHISLKKFDGYQSAIVSIDKEAVVRLLRHMFRGVKFPGAQRPISFASVVERERLSNIPKHAEQREQRQQEAEPNFYGTTLSLEDFK